MRRPDLRRSAVSTTIETRMPIDPAIAANRGIQRDFHLCLVDKSLNGFVFQAQNVFAHASGDGEVDLDRLGRHVDFEPGDEGRKQ